MLLVHQAGSVRVGEVVRYTLTYTPTYDRILPSPTHLHVKIKNTSAIPLRAAYLHGPYTLHVSTYPSSFNPNQKTETAARDGTPDFEPNLKAGGQWTSKLIVPNDIRESGEKVNSKRNIDGSPKTMKWIIEISSQILFSNTASVHFEVIVGRDERSLELGFAAVAGKGHGGPGHIDDFKAKTQESHKHGEALLPKGVYTKAVDLVVEDTADLWDKPGLPRWDDRVLGGHSKVQDQPRDPMGVGGADTGQRRTKTPKKLHLVILTHGLHSNVGADMLYLKESIDSAAKQARLEARKQRKRDQKQKHKKHGSDGSTKSANSAQNDAQDDKQNAPAPQSGGQDRLDDEDMEDSDDEQVVVRGFTGNACRTERGIQYLGKRLAKFVLTTTYPDQPILPESRSMRRSSKSGPFGSLISSHYGNPVHRDSSVASADTLAERLPYRFTSISFIGHSLGGLVQTYAIAYIHKHAPAFFEQIKPVNFVTMASPLLGLSNENPLYVKFALDFGLVGRTGQDLGLTWRAPNIVRTGWRSVIDGLSTSGHEKEEDPRAKPLLRILPTGPAHQVLKMFRNRTVYSNVVNDGIVPLRTSCLLFLDWRGLDRVENVRRENGLILTVASFGWSELTGASTSHRSAPPQPQNEHAAQDSDDEHMRTRSGKRSEVPQPARNATRDDNESQATEPAAHQFLSYHGQRLSQEPEDHDMSQPENASSSDLQQPPSTPGPIDNILSFFRPSKADLSKSPKISGKTTKTFRRAQTLKPDTSDSEEPKHRPTASRGDSLTGDPSSMPPPKTSFFESAGDLISAPIPSDSWINDPSSRDRTIFHDRVYHPDDIPPPPPPKRPLMSRTFSNPLSRNSTDDGPAEDIEGGMKVEEKIARAYHRDLAWRKVLVSLQPDAHNNMIVRRIFANAYGWDVIKHVCDTHFAYTDSALTRDEDEPSKDRAKPFDEPVSEHGDEVRDQNKVGDKRDRLHRTRSEEQEAKDDVADLETPAAGTDNLASSTPSSSRRISAQRQDSATWPESFFDNSDNDDDENGQESLNPLEHFQRFWNGTRQADRAANQAAQAQQTPDRGREHNGHYDHPAHVGNPSGRTGRQPHRREGPQVPNILTDRLTSSPSQSPAVSRQHGWDPADADPEGSPEMCSHHAVRAEGFGSPSSTASLGLRSPPAAHTVTHQSHLAGVRDAGVSEQVARSSSGGRHL